MGCNPVLEIRQIKSGKKDYLDILLLADEQESMIDRYLDRGDMFVVEVDGAAVAVCVVALECEGVAELKNLAVLPEFRNKGYGRMMVDFVAAHYAGCCHTLVVGTGDSPATVPFYERCGFSYSHRVPGFFTDNYDHPIIDGGVLLTDMLYFRKPLRR